MAGYSILATLYEMITGTLLLVVKLHFLLNCAVRSVQPIASAHWIHAGAQGQLWHLSVHAAPSRQRDQALVRAGRSQRRHPARATPSTPCRGGAGARPRRRRTPTGHLRAGGGGRGPGQRGGEGPPACAADRRRQMSTPPCCAWRACCACCAC